LSKKKRLAAYAVYAICRLSDESVDAGESQATRLAQIRSDINLAYGQNELGSPLLLAFRQTINKYSIPKIYFDDLLSGMQMDLDKNRYNNFTELNDYCYKVAGVVGLIMLKIFGAKNNEAQIYAKDLGIAMQLTNILRDIKEDYTRGRIYLPKDELDNFGISVNDLATGNLSGNFKELMKFQIQRARFHYQNSQKGIKMVSDWNSRFVILAMKELYAGILSAIEKNNYDVFKTRCHVNTFGKIILLLKIILQGQYL